MSEHNVRNKLRRVRREESQITHRMIVVTFFLFSVLALGILSSTNILKGYAEEEDFLKETEELSNNREQQEEDSKEEKEDDNRKEIDPNEFDNDEEEDQIEEEQLDDDTGDDSKDLANKQTDNDIKVDGEDETKENDLVEEEIANSLTLPQIEGKGEGPNYDCLFDPSLPHCAAEDGECPDGFNMNEDEQCIPDESCPKGYETHDKDESGTCYPVDKDDMPTDPNECIPGNECPPECPEGWEAVNWPINAQIGCLPDTIVSNEE